MSRIRICTDAPEYNNHPILTDKDRGLCCDKKILKAIDTAFNHFFDNHDRGFFIRYDVRAPDGYDDPSNDAYRSGQANFIKNLSRNRRARRIRIIMAFCWSMAGKRSRFMTISLKLLTLLPVRLVFHKIKDWLTTVPRINMAISSRTVLCCGRMIQTTSAS